MIPFKRIHEKSRIWEGQILFAIDPRATKTRNADNLALTIRRIRAQGSFNSYLFRAPIKGDFSVQRACPSFEGACYILVEDCFHTMGAIRIQRGKHFGVLLIELLA